jgi:hypothetical protein
MVWKFTLFATMIVGAAVPPSIHLFERQKETTCDTSSPAGVTTFNRNIGPMLKKLCSPCHFEGGKEYAEHPFDSYETVRSLAKKLNTRLKGENAATVNRWIAQGCPKDSSGEQVQ